MSHFATADDPGDEGFFDAQLGRFDDWAQPLRERHPGAAMHIANSAGTLRDRRAHFDMVRCGIAIYGLDPRNRDAGDAGLEPALELSSYVAELKPCAAGESAGYGRRFVAERPTTIATLPIGYGDGVRRDLSVRGGEVLIGGARYPLVGTISMDNVAVDVGPEPAVRRGERAVLIGRQGNEMITAEDVAALLGTINYEVTCAIGERVPRVHHRDGVDA